MFNLVNVFRAATIDKKLGGDSPKQNVFDPVVQQYVFDDVVQQLFVPLANASQESDDAKLMSQLAEVSPFRLREILKASRCKKSYDFFVAMEPALHKTLESPDPSKKFDLYLEINPFTWLSHRDVLGDEFTLLVRQLIRENLSNAEIFSLLISSKLLKNTNLLSADHLCAMLRVFHQEAKMDPKQITDLAEQGVKQLFDAEHATAADLKAILIQGGNQISLDTIRDWMVHPSLRIMTSMTAILTELRQLFNRSDLLYILEKRMADLQRDEVKALLPFLEEFYVEQKLSASEQKMYDQAMKHILKKPDWFGDCYKGGLTPSPMPIKLIMKMSGNALFSEVVRLLDMKDPTSLPFHLDNLTLIIVEKLKHSQEVITEVGAYEQFIMQAIGRAKDNQFLKKSLKEFFHNRNPEVIDQLCHQPVDQLISVIEYICPPVDHAVLINHLATRPDFLEWKDSTKLALLNSLLKSGCSMENLFILLPPKTVFKAILSIDKDEKPNSRNERVSPLFIKWLTELDSGELVHLFAEAHDQQFTLIDSFSSNKALSLNLFEYLLRKPRIVVTILNMIIQYEKPFRIFGSQVEKHHALRMLRKYLPQPTDDRILARIKEVRQLLTEPDDFEMKNTDLTIFSYSFREREQKSNFVRNHNIVGYLRHYGFSKDACNLIGGYCSDPNDPIDVVPVYPLADYKLLFVDDSKHQLYQLRDIKDEKKIDAKLIASANKLFDEAGAIYTRLTGGIWDYGLLKMASKALADLKLGKSKFIWSKEAENNSPYTDLHPIKEILSPFDFLKVLFTIPCFRGFGSNNLPATMTFIEVARNLHPEKPDDTIAREPSYYQRILKEYQEYILFLQSLEELNGRMQAIFNPPLPPQYLFSLDQKIAETLYMQVDRLGKGKKLLSLDNEITPAKLFKTLELLGINVVNIEFNADNGYFIMLEDSQNCSKISNIFQKIPLLILVSHNLREFSMFNQLFSQPTKKIKNMLKQLEVKILDTDMDNPIERSQLRDYISSMTHDINLMSNNSFKTTITGCLSHLDQTKIKTPDNKSDHPKIKKDM